LHRQTPNQRTDNIDNSSPEERRKRDFKLRRRMESERRAEKSDIDAWLATVADMQPFARKQALALMNNAQRKQFYYLFPALRSEQRPRHALPGE